MQEIDKIVALQRAGKSAAAEKRCQKALKLNPESYDLWHFLGILRLQQRRYGKAVSAFKSALKIRQGDPNLYNNLGMAYYHSGDYRPALEWLSKALEHGWDAGVLRHRAIVHAALEDFASAEEDFEDLLARAAEPGALIDYAEFLISRCRYTRAEEVLQQADAMALPGDIPTRSQVAGAFVGLYRDWNRFDKIYDAFETLLEFKADGHNYSIYLFHLNYHPELTGQQLFEYYRRFDEQCSVSEDARISHERPKEAYSGEKLRIAYISGDMNYAHAVTKFLMPLLENHDRDAVDITLYFTGGIDASTYFNQASRHLLLSESEVRQRQENQQKWRSRFKAHADRWSDVAQLTDEELVKRIRRDKIQVLVECSGHTAGERLGALAHRPAPVQVSWLGYGYTTGLQAIDYFLGCEEWTPESTDDLFSETVYRLPRPPLSYSPAEGMEAQRSLPCVDNGSIRFGSFSRAIRFNDKVVRCWADLLHAVPGSKLVLNTDYFEKQGNRDVFIERFAECGIDADRLELLSTLGHDTWEEYRRIDISLDPFPHNGGTTIFDSLWMGVPILSLEGSYSTQRFGGMILRELGLDDWLVNSEADYVQRGAELAQNIDGLKELRTTLRSRLEHSVFTDHVGLARTFEQAYRDMYSHFANGGSES